MVGIRTETFRIEVELNRDGTWTASTSGTNAKGTAHRQWEAVAKLATEIDNEKASAATVSRPSQR